MCNQYNKFKKGVAIEKGALIDDNDKFSSLWDTQTVAGDNLSFFPPQAQGGIRANYQGNPLPGTYDHLIVAAHLYATNRQIVAGSQAEAEGIVKALSEGVLTITADSDNKQLAQIRLAEIFNVDGMEIEHAASADGTADHWMVHLPPGEVQGLENPFVIAEGQVFNAEIEFGDASGVPDDTLDLVLRLSRSIPKSA